MQFGVGVWERSRPYLSQTDSNECLQVLSLPVCSVKNSLHCGACEGSFNVYPPARGRAGFDLNGSHLAGVKSQQLSHMGSRC